MLRNFESNLKSQMAGSASTLIFLAAIVALGWALLQYLIIAKIPVRSYDDVNDETPLAQGSTSGRLKEIYEAIYVGAQSFLIAEYTICLYFVIIFGAIVFALVFYGTGYDFTQGFFTALSFVLGALTSILSGYLGMKVAVFSSKFMSLKSV